MLVQDWTNVPLVLETIAPTFGVAIPELDTWDVQLLPIVKPASEPTSSLFAQRGPARGALFGSSSTLPTMTPPAPRARALMVAAAAPAMEHSDVQVTSQSVINTTFEVPGLISVPSDKQTHNVTIANLKLDAQLQWITVPKKDTRVFSKVKTRRPTSGIHAHRYLRRTSAMTRSILFCLANRAFTWTGASPRDPGFPQSIHRKDLTVR